nr:MAG: RNA-dependent RNA polymerase [Botourmiaviridae sp.]
MGPLRGVCHSATPDKSASGSGVQTCRICRRVDHDTRVSIQNGMRLIRIRYGIPYSELPDLKPSSLDRYIRFLLLEGQTRPSVPFPRRQRRQRGCEEGLSTLQRLWRRERWEFAHSMASLKRNLPRECPRCVTSQRDAWRHRVTNPPPLPPQEYFAFARKVTREVFYRGWDRNYESFVEAFVPNASSRKTPRTRGDTILAEKGGDRYFRRCTLAGKGFDTGLLSARYKEVPSAGKTRALTIFDDRSDLLGPLHKMAYRHLQGQPWLLAGPPTEGRISSVCRHRCQTSVDLVAATDGLFLPVASTILETMLARASRVPGEIRLLAVNSLPILVDDWVEGSEGPIQVSHGQMMGGYLSFPLLCLQSYIAARWATRGVEAEFLVNGDDTLISSDSPVRKESYPVGFQLNEGKTIRSQVVAEINSTCFLKDGKGRWRQVHHLRRGSFLTDFSGMQHAAAAVRSSCQWTDAFIRSRIGKKWGFSPWQLGLFPLSYPGFCRNRELRTRRADTPLPSQVPALPETLRAVRGQPDPDEVIALQVFLRNNGRQGPDKRAEPRKISVGEVRRSYHYLKRAPRFRLSFLSQIKQLPSVVKDDMYFVPAEYESRRETDGVKESLRYFCP